MVTEVTITPVIRSTCLQRNTELNKLGHTHTHTQQYFECLTFEGQEDPGSREGLVGGGQPPGR